MAEAVQNVVIALNLTGEGQVSTAVDKINVNLTAAERSGSWASGRARVP